jgi:hypothetical protein
VSATAGIELGWRRGEPPSQVGPCPPPFSPSERGRGSSQAANTRRIRQPDPIDTRAIAPTDSSSGMRSTRRPGSWLSLRRLCMEQRSAGRGRSGVSVGIQEISRSSCLHNATVASKRLSPVARAYRSS